MLKQFVLLLQGLLGIFQLRLQGGGSFPRFRELAGGCLDRLFLPSCLGFEFAPALFQSGDLGFQRSLSFAGLSKFTQLLFLLPKCQAELTVGLLEAFQPGFKFKEPPSVPTTLSVNRRQPGNQTSESGDEESSPPRKHCFLPYKLA